MSEKKASLKNKTSKYHHDYEYISNDPEENADNFDRRWEFFRGMNTNEERYLAIRKRWGNLNIPDPQINLSCRQMKTQLETDTKENCVIPSTSSENNVLSMKVDSEKGLKGKRLVSRRRSRSCTRPYEQLISNLEKNYQIEYSQLMYRQELELQEMLQIQLLQTTATYNFYTFEDGLRQNLEIQQKQQVYNLLAKHYKEMQCFMGEKYENIDAYIKYIEEIKDFFTFYQKINDDEVTLQMTDEQYEHTIETERMYSLYRKFYG